MGRKLEDLTGRRFGRLTVIEQAAQGYYYDAAPYGKPFTAARWVCRCDCGKTVTVIGCNLRGGRTRSCGCLMRDRKRTGVARDKPLR